jgi:predicted GH43/DUF377 family glycosyl hydrolase
MKIEKRGLIYAPDNGDWWRMRYAMMPTPVYIPEKKCIRIFFGITDNEIYGRTTFLDVDQSDPSKVLTGPTKILLDLGEHGTFDDSGAIPSSVIIDYDDIKLYYVGFQRVTKVPYMLFSGLATTKNIDNFFVRVSTSPIIERTANSPYSNAAPFVIKQNDLYKMWFWEGERWVSINGKKYIQAVISYAESEDGLLWSIKKKGCIKPSVTSEFSVGRPWVLYHKNKYRMFYSVRYIDKLYRIGYAESINGIDWDRKDNEICIDVSEEGWDSEMICYPAVVTVQNKTYLFYNGNNNGETGFGYAELVDWE